MRVVRVHAEAHRRCLHCPAVVFGDVDPRRLCRNSKTRARAQVVVAEADVGTSERDVGAALDIGRAAVGIVDWLAVDRDAHQVQAERIFGAQLTRHARDVHTLVLVEDREFVVDNLHGDVRGVALDEPGVHDVVRVNEAASLELGLFGAELHVRSDLLHGATCP